MLKGRIIRFIVTSSFLAMLSVSLFSFGGTAFAAGTPKRVSAPGPNFVSCEPHEVIDPSLISSDFTSSDVVHEIDNFTNLPITQTITTSFTTALSATFSVETSGKAGFVFAEASVKLGLSLTGSVSINAGTSTAIQAEAHHITYIQHGGKMDRLWVHDYFVNDHCNNFGETFSEVDAPQASDVWKVTIS